MRTVFRWTRRFLFAILALTLLLGLAFLIVIRTQWIRDQIRTRIILEAEKATGGKVEMKYFDFDPTALRVVVKDFSLRGKEPSSDPPLAHVAEIRAGVKVVSFLRRDLYLESLEVDRPDIRIIIFPDGSNNIPGPKVSKPGGRSVFELFVSLAARKFAIKDGSFIYDNRRIPVDLLAENLKLQFGWERDGPRYRGTVSATPFHFNWPVLTPLTFDAEVQLTMDKQGLGFQSARIRNGKSLILASGSMRDYRAPKLDIDVDGNFDMAHYAKPLRLPIRSQGTARFKGKFTYGDGLYLLAGPVTGQDLAVDQPLWTVDHIGLTSDIRLEPEVVQFNKLKLTALNGGFNGSGFIRHWRSFEFRGAVSDLDVEDIRNIGRTQRPFAWSASLSGPVQMSGLFVPGGVREFLITSRLAVEPLEGKIPLEGILDTTWRQAGNIISFGSSYLKTSRTRIGFTGDVDNSIRLLVDTTDLNDFLPAVALASDDPPADFPVQLDGGSARFEGTVGSPLGSPRIHGRLSATKAVYAKRKIDSIAADFDIDSSRITARKVLLQQEGSQVEGDFNLALDNWRANSASPLLAHFDLRSANIEQLLQGSQPSIPLKGILSGPVTVEGSLADPSITAKLIATPFTVGEETFQSLRGDVRFTSGLIDFTNGQALHAAGAIPFRARYQHPRDIWDRGRLTFTVASKNAQLAAIPSVRKLREDIEWDARLDIDATGDLAIENSQPLVQSINGVVAIRQITLGPGKKMIGALNLQVKTQGERVDALATGDLLGSPIKGNGEWSLRGDAAGLGTLELGSLTLAKVNEVLKAAGGTREIPLDGSFQGEIVISGALRKLNAMRARANLSRVELFPRNDRSQFTPAVLQELTLRNNGPIVFEGDAKGLQVIQTELTGKETNLKISGNLATSNRNAWNLVLKGGLNLGIFQNYVPGLRTTGAAVINATVRGTLDKPLFGGLMEINNASVFHRDLTNGVEKANGVIAFDRNRALLQNFTAQTGGGELKMTGFLSIPAAGEAITYRVNGQMERVRIRYPEGASTTVNANLSLTGTSDQSLLSGAVTVLRSGFTPRTDIGSVLLGPAKPIQAPTTSALLRGMQFDIHVASAQNLVLETSLTSGLQTTVDLRLRGSPSKPVILGTVSATQGELNFFGTTYQITRGTVSFFNAARIEPVLDLDLETVVRAITVSMNVSGTLDKPNITYRSDPPLQPSDIIALLTVGRAPGSSTVATQSNIASSQSGLFAGTDAVLGQAVSAGVSSRLQRFFGVSKVKIDPQLLGLDTTPQARLTIEQQISRDITLTYVTNLTGALQQLVRLQWDFRRNWSIVAVRDENGTLGGDILYRKRFK